jgi:hypothetical protein
MNKKVAVEKSLASIQQYFKNQGYEVDSFTDGELDTIGSVSNYTAIITTGGNQDFMGMENVLTQIPIIVVDGMTPDEVFTRVSTHNNFQ